MSFESQMQVVKSDDITSFSTLPIYSPGVQHMKDGNTYVYVYNGASDSAIATGKYCVLQASSSSLTSGYTVTVTNASLAGYMVGVAQNTIPTGTYGFVMTRGVSLVSLDSGQVSFNASAELALGTDGGFVAAGATFSTAPRFGLALNSGVTTVGTSKARLFHSII